MLNKYSLKKLKHAYRNKKLVPFIGAGLGFPFGMPSWGTLIEEISGEYVDENLIPAIDKYIENQDYWGAIKLIKDLGCVSDFDIQTNISQIISMKMDIDIDDKLHNYKDISNMKFSNIFTTNYDFLITKYINNPTVFPQILHKVDINSQTFFDTNTNINTRVWHLHGHILDVGSIVISKEKYDELYSNDKYNKIFELFQGNSVFLFLGFSMNDIYIKKIFELNKEYYNSQHFIVLDNPTPDLKKELKEIYNINIIEYDSTKKGHVESIREILNYISSEDDPDESENDNHETDANLNLSKSIIKVPCKEEKKKVSQNLFYRKLYIEDIDDISCDLSSDCFIMAELVTRQLRKDGFEENIINEILASAYMEYKDIKYKLYRKDKNSQIFLDAVHNALENYNFSIKINLNLNKFHKRGFIHILADDINQDIWWGEKRIDA